MTELYAFLFSFGLGVFARLLYMVETALAKRTDILPVTVVLDVLAVAVIGGAFTAYIVLTGTPVAPYMFAALFSGCLFTYWATKRSRKPRR